VTNTDACATQRADDGFGLVEVMVSMLIFAILLVSVALLLVSSLKVTSRNSSIESATQWAAEQSDWAHASVAGLDSVKACPKWTSVLTTPTPANRVDGRGMAMKMLVSGGATPSTCLTSTNAPTVTYTVTVVEAAHPSNVLARSTTSVALGLE